MKEELDHSKEAFSAPMHKRLEESRQTMQVPEHYFETRSVLLESALKESMDVPGDYFQEQHKQIFEQLTIPTAKNNVRYIRLTLALAAAAMMVGVLFMVLPGREETPRFSEQLEQTPIEFEDLEELDFDEEVLEEFIILDTLSPDTTSSLKKPFSIEDFKPSKGQSVISWDDINAEDIEDYLKDEETIEIIDEL